ncbi:hypothetical protein TIFTF001_004782 [Ficus carica]|uniref:Uncharacterized protein n=1 Tax=Ficus carica TaxID=3494 RepID=A0AA88A5P8_FICCA|nr:hypothetical protein TIFTF001_004782 [Ficus carica]
MTGGSIRRKSEDMVPSLSALGFQNQLNAPPSAIYPLSSLLFRIVRCLSHLLLKTSSLSYAERRGDVHFGEMDYPFVFVSSTGLTLAVPPPLRAFLVQIRGMVDSHYHRSHAHI